MSSIHPWHCGVKPIYSSYSYSPPNCCCNDSILCDPVGTKSMGVFQGTQ